MANSIRRRDVITLAAGAAAFAMPPGTQAQQPQRMRRVGALIPGTESDQLQLHKVAFDQGLQKLGWSEGRNIRIDYRWGAGQVELMRTLAMELVGLRPDVIFAGDTPSLAALRQSTRSIPIVFAWVGDPVGGGFVKSLARPGDNITGFIPTEPPLAGKWVELLKEIAPQVNRVTFLYNPDTASYAQEFLRYAQTAAAAYAVELISAPVHDEAEMESALDTAAREANGGLVVLNDQFAFVHRGRIISLAAQHRLPAIYGSLNFTNDGGLISYGNDLNDDYRLAAGYVDRILRGEKPADLPVQAPVRFELIVNLRAAKAIGLTIPETFLVRADKVIE